MTNVAAPVDAATVMVVRHGVPVGESWQVYMVRRPVRSDFAADVFVFPGGKVDGSDRDPALSDWVDGHPDQENAPDGRDEWRALRIAAVRELFEEAGVLMAHRPDEPVVRLVGADAERFDKYRRRLRAGDLTMLELAREENLRFALDRLKPFSRWITPETFPRRFDTRFFIALMPEHQTPIHDAEEATASVWIAPGDAVRRFRHRDFPLVFATERHLEQLAGFPSIEAVMAAEAEANLQPVMPKVVNRDGREEFLIPGDPGYDQV
ncbi:MAG TPA: hypothetical protein VFB58_08560 [Chloroflexota bacterium]|nr:hypothetical protein [Chloroflexota bacterium]